MNIYEKLQNIRVELQKKDLKKSGENKFVGYKYFELQDFLPTINEYMLEAKLFSFISFGTRYAKLTIINSEAQEEKIVFSSPMAKAALKSCHDVQNLGAVQTYLRRYLYINAFEIVENDALDSSVNNNEDVSSPPAEINKSSAVNGNEGKKCPKCGKDLVIRKGSKGDFLGCSGFRDGCRHTEQIVNDDIPF